MSMTDFKSPDGSLIATGYDHDGIFVAGRIGRQLDEALNPADYDRGGHETTPHQVVQLVVAEALVNPVPPSPEIQRLAS